MRSLRLPLTALALAAAIGCAPKMVPAPTVVTPKFPEFVAPSVPPALAGTHAAESQDRGWRFLQVGDLKQAEREFSTALQLAPAFFPAESGLGYVELARKDPKSALPHFERVLEGQAKDVSALVGRGQALVGLGRESEAVKAFQAALALEPGMVDVARRVEVLKFRLVEQEIAHARQAARNGKPEEAVAAYKTALDASPDSPVLYRELGGAERQAGDAQHALEHFRRAVELDPTDAKSLAQIGELLEARGDFDGASRAYIESVALEPNPAVDARLEAVRAKIELSRLPEEYRAIPQDAQITRGDLAALIGVRLAPLIQGGRRRDAALITDVRTHWAATWIMAVARDGVMEPFPNHTFQPRAVIHRTDLAQAVSRLLAHVAAANPAQAKAWQSARLSFPDLSSGHLAYPAASEAVAAGVMKTGENGAFMPGRVVSGEEAVAAIDRLEALSRPAGSKRGGGQ